MNKKLPGHKDRKYHIGVQAFSCLHALMAQKHFVWALFCALSVFTASSQIKLPRLISDGMVLQRDIPLKIWGWSSPTEKITIHFKNKNYTSVADENGNWLIQLPAQKTGGPFTMRIKGADEITLNNILVGDVWICSGQSNMELWMGRIDRYHEEKKATNNFIRQFLVPDKYNFKSPQKDIDAGSWVAANPQTINDFSAVAYFFAREIFEKHKIPIGLINTALGGSPAEAWISEEALKTFPSYYNEAQKFKDDDLISQIDAKDKTAQNSWFAELNKKDDGLYKNWKSSTVDDANWKTISLPGYWPEKENGVVWFRKLLEIPHAMLNKTVKLELGRIVDADSVFINGVYVGNTTYQYPPRRYQLQPGILKPGLNAITIRVVNSNGKGGFVPDKRYELTTDVDTVNLSGTWKYQYGATMSALPGQTFIRWKPVGLYNAMIAPLHNYAIKGAIWYQGESNAGRPADYKSLMQTLIEDWRNKWQQGAFPFLFVQLPNYMEAKPAPQESSWAALRQQQLNTLTIPNTSMAITIDLGDWNDIHPENKKDVGHRLALLARKNVYGEKGLVASGPLYQSQKPEGNKIVISFTHTGRGLVAKDGELKHFAIAAADKNYVWANAVIKNDKVIVWSDAITNPMYVRYAWADNPVGANLYNKEGLPASPFTTDN